MAGKQLRLFPPANPLRERLGAEFFRQVPAAPGVYLMTGEEGRLLYVGQSVNLRARLRSYQYLDPERASRKTLRLVRAVRRVSWETVSTPLEAQLRENALLRLHKPRFNVMNTRPEYYPFVLVRRVEESVTLRVVMTPAGEADEEVFGAFKGLNGTRRALGSLRRLLWCLAHPGQSVTRSPGPLLEEIPRSTITIEPVPFLGPGLVELILGFLGGRDGRLLERIERQAPPAEAQGRFEMAIWQQDMERVRTFHRFGPARNRALRPGPEDRATRIEQSELDDLLTIQRAGRKPDASAGDGALPLSRQGEL